MRCRTSEVTDMKDGFIKAAAITPPVKVADTRENTAQMKELMRQSYAEGARILVFPELAVTGYTCQDLFWQKALCDAARRDLEDLIKSSEDMKALMFVGCPLVWQNRLYNTAVAFGNGRVLGVVPKHDLPNHGGCYEKRHFSEGKDQMGTIRLLGQDVPFGMNLLFCADGMPDLTVAAEIGADLWGPCPPSISHAVNGANVIVNPAAGDACAGKGEYRRTLVEGQSARLCCAYIYACCGAGESTQDQVFAGHDLIAGNGKILAEELIPEGGICSAVLDVQELNSERMRSAFGTCSGLYSRITFELEISESELPSSYPALPFVPSEPEKRKQRCEEIFSIQAMGLKKRMEHIGCRHLVVGISGGLDSTLALLVMVRAFDALGLDRRDITAVTMPGFGTTDRTYDNACKMTRTLGCTLREISIKKAVQQHFSDIGQDETVHDVTYENAQARERTQILMDLANQVNALVVGTGDMSELALGWATYNGDHMSMYGVNASVPKTLVRHLVRYYADTCEDAVLRDVLYDVLDTPVSPELLPPKDGQIAQVTEDLVGPYELHDFFLYYMMRYGFGPSKIYRIACAVFEETYGRETILKWLRTFCRRFFTQQYKRSCVPDGPKVGSVALSPRGDLRMPSDANVKIWLEDLPGEGR